MAASDDGREDEDAGLNSLLPFVIETDARRLTIKEAIAAQVYREPGQLDIQWGDGKKYGLHYRSRENCVLAYSGDDVHPDPGD
jgi:hypothetical protein